MPTRKTDLQSIVNSLRIIRREMSACSQSKSTGIAAEEAKSARVIAKTEAVTPSQWAVLEALLKLTTAGVKEIATVLGITSSAATQLIGGLVEKGYLIRQDNVDDRRAQVVQLAPEHRHCLAGLKIKMMNRFTILFDGLTDKELAHYAALNQKIADSISNAAT